MPVYTLQPLKPKQSREEWSRNAQRLATHDEVVEVGKEFGCSSIKLLGS